MPKSALQEAVDTARTKVAELNAALGAVAVADKADDSQTLQVAINGARGTVVDGKETVSCLKAVLSVKVSREL